MKIVLTSLLMNELKFCFQILLINRSQFCKWQGKETSSLLHALRVVKGIFVTRDRPFLFPVKCEMAKFFLVNRDFHSSREA